MRMLFRELQFLKILILGVSMIANYVAAENYGLLMSIGNYSNPNASLPGIDLDEHNASIIAKSMGVSEKNILYYRDADMSEFGVNKAFSQLKEMIRKGDNVFIYYSGHGTQRSSSKPNGKCSEGMVTYDMTMYSDSKIQSTLVSLSQKAGKIVFMNDSCFSGGQAEADIEDKRISRTLGSSKSKLFKLYESASGTPGYICGDAVNAKMTRNVIPAANKGGANLLYIAAARDNEVASATREGSAATLAWLRCLIPESDTNNSSTLTGEEIRVCAQKFLEKNSFSQHIALVGNKDLPLTFVENSSPNGEMAQNQASQLLNDIHNSASPDIQVSLKVIKQKLKINEDALDFSVTTSKAGYLTILQVGSDGKTFNQLFPNSINNDSLIKKGTINLPHASWRIKAGGPAGTSYLMAIVSETPRDFSKGMEINGPFKSGSSTRNLYIVATGVDSSAPGRYGSSNITPVDEF